MKRPCDGDRVWSDVVTILSHQKWKRQRKTDSPSETCREKDFAEDLISDF